MNITVDVQNIQNRYMWVLLLLFFLTCGHPSCEESGVSV